MKQILFVLSLLILSLPACKTYDTSLSFYEVQKPIQLGNFKSDVSLDSLRDISGFWEILEEEDTYSENENTSITMLGGEYVTSDIDSSLLSTLVENPTFFLGNSTIQLEIKHGIKVGTLIFGTIAASITDEESNIGTFTIKKFTQKGTLYDSKKNRGEHEK